MVTFALLGLHAVKLVTEEGRKIAEMCRGPERHRIMQLCDEIDRLADQLADLQRRGLVSGCLASYVWWRVHIVTISYLLGSVSQTACPYWPLTNVSFGLT